MEERCSESVSQKLNPFNSDHMRFLRRREGEDEVLIFKDKN